MNAESGRAMVIWSLTVLVSLIGFAVSVDRDHPVDLVSYTLLPLAVATVGALVTARHPRHRVGWVFVVFGAYLALVELVQGYSLLATDLDLPGRDVSIWVWTWVWSFDPAVWALVAAIFPNGHLPSRAWLWLPWAAFGGGALVAVGMALSSVQDNYYPAGDNPFTIEGPLPLVALSIGSAAAMAGLVGGITALVQRLRLARGVERQQLRLFAVTASALVLFSVIAIVVSTQAPGTSRVLETLAFNGVPLAAAVGVAILRYRLYDIDVVVNRALVYGSLTVTLVAVYLGSVLLLQVTLRPVTADSDLAVAISTLAVAALFGPARRRIQAGVDRRFYRHRYDAARTVADFIGRLRHQVDMDTIGTDLVRVVDDTVQPASTRLWVRP